MFAFFITAAIICHGVALMLSSRAHASAAPDWAVFLCVATFAGLGGWATWLAATLP